MKKILPILIASACLSTACATTTPAPNPALAIQPQAPEAQAAPEQSAEAEQAQLQTHPGISINDVQDFTPHTAWPDMPADHAPVYNINSGTDDAVWVEGKGYFKGSLDDVYADLTNVMIIGPNHLTEDIVRDEFVETPNRTTYTMHVKMKYVLSIKFDLGAIIDALYDRQTRVGLLYHNEKTAGTTFIKMISTTLVIKQLPDGMFSAEVLSQNKATQNKEDEARKHIETLFGYWAIQSQSR